MGEHPPGPDAVRGCVSAVADLFGPLRDRLVEAAGEVAAGLQRDDGGAPRAEEVVALTGPLAATLLADRRLLGAGFVGAPDLASDEDYLLAWWQGEQRERITELAALRRAADYSRKEWYTTPLRTGAVHVAGPYIDYVCSDEFVLTVTAPVVDPDGTALGVMGADVLAETVEQILGGTFRSADATLVNHRDRIVVPGDVRTFAGEPLDTAAYATRTECAGLPLSVLSRAP